MNKLKEIADAIASVQHELKKKDEQDGILFDAVYSALLYFRGDYKDVSRETMRKKMEEAIENRNKVKFS